LIFSWISRKRKSRLFWFLSGVVGTFPEDASSFTGHSITRSKMVSLSWITYRRCTGVERPFVEWARDPSREMSSDTSRVPGDLARITTFTLTIWEFE
jgi:hypothetical protein